MYFFGNSCSRLLLVMQLCLLPGGGCSVVSSHRARIISPGVGFKKPELPSEYDTGVVSACDYLGLPNIRSHLELYRSSFLACWRQFRSLNRVDSRAIVRFVISRKGRVLSSSVLSTFEGDDRGRAEACLAWVANQVRLPDFSGCRDRYYRWPVVIKMLLLFTPTR